MSRGKIQPRNVLPAEIDYWERYQSYKHSLPLISPSTDILQPPTRLSLLIAVFLSLIVAPFSLFSLNPPKPADARREPPLGIDSHVIDAESVLPFLRPAKYMEDHPSAVSVKLRKKTRKRKEERFCRCRRRRRCHLQRVYQRDTITDTITDTVARPASNAIELITDSRAAKGQNEIEPFHQAACTLLARSLLPIRFNDLRCWACHCRTWTSDVSRGGWKSRAAENGIERNRRKRRRSARATATKRQEEREK